MADWHPIETAPKDGREVILAVKLRAGIPHGVLVGHYMPGGHCIEDHPAIDAGWYFWNSRMFDKAAQPTHWMPLPHHPEWKPDGWQARKQGAPGTPEAGKAQEFFCNKCGYFGPVQAFHERPNGSGKCDYMAAPVRERRCNAPPPGWACSREPGHDGPCAASPHGVTPLQSENDPRMAFCPACFVEVTPEQAGAQINAARVLAEFAKTAPGRLPSHVQEALAVIDGVPSAPVRLGEHNGGDYDMRHQTHDAGVKGDGNG